MRVPLFLSDHHVPFELFVHAPAFTASRRAQRLEVEPDEVAECALLAVPAGYVVAIVPGGQSMDLKAVARTLGSPVDVADAATVAQIFRDCEWGTLVPFGTLYGVSTIVDELFQPAQPFAFAAHGNFRSLRMAYRDFERLEQPRRFAFTRSQRRPRSRRIGA